METYTVADNRTTETYMIPGASSNPPTFYPQLEEIGYMGNEALPPEFIVDQGIYYPAANYYGYYSPGFESFGGELDDQNRILGSDGQDNTHYSQGLPNESLPYAYYTPNYGYPQSPYNPYNPYIPGAVVGPDGSFIGGQQYVTNPSYQLSAYIPLGVQPGTEVPDGGLDPSMYITSAPISSVEGNTGLKNMSLLASGASAANSQRLDSVNPAPNTSLSSQIIKASEGLVVGTAAHMNQVRNSSGLPHSRAPSVQNPQRVTLPSNNNFSRFGSNARGWVPVDKVRPRMQFNGSASNPTGGMDSVLGEQNKGPRTNRSKVQLTSAINGATPTRSCGSNAQGSILIDADQYNRDDFHVNYPNAKFFVIKSYSEDDVHKSIKYNVWSSTPNGNRKLDSAYEDAKRISSGNAKICPVFLFFSVNASGQFCGVSEMIGPVDFHKDMDIWQQDKWMGSFPVKWHMIKDVPNTSFRHIILENNENKPVTNSRDTQEIPYLPGISMLNIFKSSTLKTSILDDFEFYEERERILQTEKARILGKIYDPSQFVPAVLPLNRTSKVDKQTDDKLNDPPRADDKQPNGPLHELTKPDGKQANGPPRADEMQPNGPLRELTKPDGKQVNDPPRAAEMQPNGPLRELTKSDGKQTNDAAIHTIKPSGNPVNGAVHSSSKSDGKMTELLKSGGKPPGNVNQTLKTNSKSLNFVVVDRAQSKPAGPKSPSDQPPNAAKKSTKPKDLKSTVQAEVKGPNYMRNSGKPEDLESSSIKAGRSDEDDGTHKLNPIKILDDKSNPKAWIQTIGPKGIASRTGSEVVEIIPDDVVTVGSVRIKVNGSADSSSSSIISLGPVGPKGSEK